MCVGGAELARLSVCADRCPLDGVYVFVCVCVNESERETLPKLALPNILGQELRIWV